MARLHYTPIAPMPPPSTPAPRHDTPTPSKHKHKSKDKKEKKKKKKDKYVAAKVTDYEAYQNYSMQVIMSLSNLQGGLTHVQNGLTDLLRAYMAHTASVLAGGAETSLENLQLPEHIAESATAATEAAQAAGRAIAQAVQPVSAVATKKRKRAQKEKDPNRPKRPLTAAFLYAQNARGVVRKDLEEALGPGDKLEPNAVNLEVTKRWNEMPEDQKEVSRMHPD